MARDLGTAESLVSALMSEGQPMIDARQSGLVTHTTPAGDVRAFVRVIEPPVRLVICGAGDDAQPLARMAHTLGWRVWVLDHRAGFATTERFSEAERVEVVVAGTLPAGPDARSADRRGDHEPSLSVRRRVAERAGAASDHLSRPARRAPSHGASPARRRTAPARTSAASLISSRPPASTSAPKARKVSRSRCSPKCSR